MKIAKILFSLGITVLLSNYAFADKEHHQAASKKLKRPLSVMVLGSGGPAATADGRASAGYLIFTDGKPRILMDAGGGTFQRLAKSGVNIKDLDIILLSHLHIDHTADLSAMIKTIYFHNNQARSAAAAKGIGLKGRTAPINIYGPGETTLHPGPGVTYPNGLPVYPSTTEYIDNHYSVAKGGVERYLTAFVAAISDDDGPAGSGKSVSKFAYTAHDLSSKVPNAKIETVVVTNDALVVKAIAVDHGPVPAVAYRIEYKGKVIVYSGDTGTKGRGPAHLGQDNMNLIAHNADLLIYDTSVMEVGDAPANPLFHILHSEPSLIASVAKEANVKKLVLSHLTSTTSHRIKDIKRIIHHQGYAGKISEAQDLNIYNLDE